MEKLLNSDRYYNSNKIFWNVDKKSLSLIKKLQDKIAKEEISLEYIDNCIICNNSSFENIAERDRYNFPVGTVICKKCGFIFRNPRLSPSFAETFYNNYYTKIFKSNLTYDSYFKNQRNHAGFIWDFMKNNLDGIEYIIENGSGPGGILSFFQDKGYKVTGYDLDKSYSNWNYHNKPKIKQGDINSIIENHEQPDLIIMSNVLEHTFNPFDELKKAHNALNDNGLIFIEVPGIRSFIEGHYSLCGCNNPHPYSKDILREFVIAHNFEFDATTISYILNKCGFEIIKINELVRVIAQKRDNYVINYQLENNYKRNKEYLIKLENERKIYNLNPSVLKSKIRKTLGKTLRKMKIVK